jgi:hypothetical protein
VNTKARTPGSAATRVSTWRRLDAPPTKRSIPERSKRATPSAPTSAPRASPTGFPSSSTVTAAYRDGPGSITTFTSPLGASVGAIQSLVSEENFDNENRVVPADLNHVRWVSHCRDLVQLPVAA